MVAWLLPDTISELPDDRSSHSELQMLVSHDEHLIELDDWVSHISSCDRIIACDLRPCLCLHSIELSKKSRKPILPSLTISDDLRSSGRIDIDDTIVIITDMRKSCIVMISYTVEELTCEFVVWLVCEYLRLDMIFHRQKRGKKIYLPEFQSTQSGLFISQWLDDIETHSECEYDDRSSDLECRMSHIDPEKRPEEYGWYDIRPISTLELGDDE